MIDFIDLFSGIAGFRLGLSRSGNYRCVWSCDNNKYANEIYTKHFGEENHHPSDIEGVDPEDIPNFDLLCAGFPCQAFSVAGKRKGFQDTRGTLFFEICRIARAKRPTLLLLENVKGLLSHDGGRTFTIILQSLDELGYWLEWQVLNSKYFGVPQNRERVFIVGHLRGGSTRPLFPISQVHPDDSQGDKTESWGQIGATLSAKSAGGRNARGNYVVTPRVISTALDANYWKGPDKHDARTIIIDYLNRSIREDEIFNTLKTSQGSPSSAPSIAISFTNPRSSKEKRIPNLRSFVRSIKPPYGNQQPLVGVMLGHRGRYKDANRTPIQSEGISWCLSQSGDAGVMDGVKIRRLTPIECERLQGFPDGWTEGVSDTQRYRLLGNAVTVNVIEFLGELIMSCFTNKGEPENASN